MAALIGHGTSVGLITGKTQFLRIITNPIKDVTRFKSNGRKSTKPPPIIKDKFEWTEESLASRGFLRPLKSYKPGHNISERVANVCKTVGLTSDDSTTIDDLSTRFQVFSACTTEFNYSIPNSLLHKIETVGDLVKFYETPIDSTLPFDAARKSVLPPNLHIQYEYNRFHPDTDTKFDGKTAFPKSSTLVVSIRHKKKYQNLIQKSPFALN